MEKIIGILVLMSLSISAKSQADTSENQYSEMRVRQGQLYGGLSFALGFMTENTQNIFIQGDLGYHVHKNVSIRADGYYFINSIGDRPRFDMNHQIFFGGDFHFPFKFGLTPHVGIQPGIAISRSSEYSTLNTSEFPPTLDRKVAVNPIISPVFGLTYHAPKYFYLFLEGRYVFGTHMANSYPTNLDEIRLQFGLGWFFNFKIKK